jgi:pimeloyl-ACP methyl ester carboxylesterase
MSHPILLLHGAIGASVQLQPLADELKKSGFDPKLFDFTGHGGREMPNVDFSIALFADEVISWMDDHRIGDIDIFGYSMGGYVGLYLAKHYPERIGKIMTVATKLEWSIEIAEKERKMLNPEKITEKVPKFAEALAARHAPADWKEVLARTAGMMTEMGVHPPMNDVDFSTIENRVLMCVGDKDTMVSQQETEHVARLIQNAELRVLADAPHPVEQMNVQLLAKTAEDFFKS